MTHRKIEVNKIKKVDLINTNGMLAKEVYEKYKPDFMLNLALYDTESSVNIVNLVDENVKSGYLFSKEGIGILHHEKPFWCTLDRAVEDDEVFDFVAGAPVLIKDGKPCVDWGNKYSSYVDKTHYRSALALTKSGDLILYVSDAKLTINQLVNELLKLQVNWAINLDGGGSCHLQEGSREIKGTGRGIVSWILVYTEKEVEKPMKQYKVMLDPGHGGKDPGAIGPSGLKEKDVALELARKVARELVANGVLVENTRQDDNRIIEDSKKDLTARADKANKLKVDYYVSLHCNSLNADSKGIETFVIAKGGEAEKLAESVQLELFKSSMLANRGVKVCNLAVLRETDMPAILVELGFISNPNEERLLKDESYIQQQAEAIARGICKYLNIPYKSVEGTDEKDKPSEWAKEAWKWAIDSKITDGTNPQGAITREQMVSMLYRYNNRK